MMKMMMTMTTTKAIMALMVHDGSIWFNKGVLVNCRFLWALDFRQWTVQCRFHSKLFFTGCFMFFNILGHANKYANTAHFLLASHFVQHCTINGSF